MGHCNDDGFAGSLNDNDVAGKPFENDSLRASGSGFARQGGAGKNILFNKINGSFNCVKELCAESRLFPFIPFGCGGCFFGSLLRNPNPPHYRAPSRARILLPNSSRSSSLACPASIA